MIRFVAALILSLELTASASAFTAPRQMTDGNYTATNRDYYIGTVVPFTAPRTLTLPSIPLTCIESTAFPSCPSMTFQFIDNAGAISSTNTLTILPALGQTINGLPSITLSVPNSSVILWTATASNWFGYTYQNTTIQTFQSQGAACDGVTNDLVAINRALALGGRWTSFGSTCAVAGNIVLPSASWIQDASFIQLSASITNVRTLVQLSGVGPTLLRVSVNRNGLPSQGTVNQTAGIWLQNVTDPLLIDVEVYGNSAGQGIQIIGATRPRLIRLNIHDMTYSALVDPGIEQIIGVQITSSTDVYLEYPSIRNMLAIIGGNPAAAINTDCMDFGGDANVTVIGGLMDTCHEGIDTTGSGINSGVRLYGVHYNNVRDIGEKWVHDVHDSGSTDSVVTNAGLTCYAIDGGTNADTEGSTRLTLTNPICINPGFNGVWATDARVGGVIVFGAIHDPQDIKIVNLTAIDLQNSPTMKWCAYSERNSPAVAQLIGNLASCAGFTVGTYFGFDTGRYITDSTGQLINYGALKAKLDATSGQLSTDNSGAAFISAYEARSGGSLLGYGGYYPAAYAPNGALGMHFGTNGSSINMYFSTNFTLGGVMDGGSQATAFWKKFVTTKTTSPYNLAGSDGDHWFNNVSAGIEINFNLPTAVVGLHYGFCVDAAQNLRVTAGTSATINVGGAVSASAGNVVSAQPGACIELLAITATKWVASSVTGTGGTAGAGGWTVN